MRTAAVVVALLFTLLAGAVSAQEALQPQAPPEAGAWTLAPGFTPDPMRVPALIGGGDIDAIQRQLGNDCAGFITAEPDARITLAEAMPLLNLIFVADALTTDTTLVVYAPDGSFRCNNNFSAGLFNPMVTLNPAAAGDYAIWIGGFTPEVAVYGELFVTTRADAQPGSTGLVLPVATTVPTPVPAGLMTPTPIPGTFLDPTLPPAHADVTLAHGFLPDPFTTIVIGGGELAVPPLDTGRADSTTCAGYATSEPDVRLSWSGESPGLRFHVLPVTEGIDAALIVRTPDGRWLCNAEFAPGFTDPSVEVVDPPEGVYLAWAAYQAGPNTRYTAGLIITEINSTPGTLNPPGSTALPFVAGPDPGAGGTPILFDQEAPDPLALAAPLGFTPGTVDLAALNPPPEGSNTPVCSGFIPAAPTISVDLTFPYPYLRVFFVGAEGTDATLVVHMPDGRWFCSDDSLNSKHPLIDIIGPPASGTAQVWVGSFTAQDGGVMGTLYLTRGSASPSAPTISTPFTALTEINLAPPAVSAQVFPTALPAQATGPLTPDAAPNYGRVTLFSATPPHTVQVIGGGEQEASKASEACLGVVSAQPDYVIDWQGAAVPLRVFFVGEGDATLVVLGPDGVLRCSDDSYNSVMPTVDIAAGQSGAYHIWVGSFAAGTTAPGTLFFTDDLSRSPVSP